MQEHKIILTWEAIYDAAEIAEYRECPKVCVNLQIDVR